MRFFIGQTKITKSEAEILKFIKSQTLAKHTNLKREKRSFKLSIVDIASITRCTERTVNRAIKTFTALNLIIRVKPAKKFYKTANWTQITNEFHELTKDFFQKQNEVLNQEINAEYVARKSKNVATRISNINKYNINYKTNNNYINKTETIIKTVRVSSKIKNIDLKEIDIKYGITHRDLQIVQNVAKWDEAALQDSVLNFAEAMESGLLTTTNPKSLFLATLTGNKFKIPRLFGRLSAVIKKEKQEELAKKQTEINTRTEQEKLAREFEKDNVWTSLQSEEKNQYLQGTSSIEEAIETAYHRELFKKHFPKLAIKQKSIEKAKPKKIDLFQDALDRAFELASKEVIQAQETISMQTDFQTNTIFNWKCRDLQNAGLKYKV